ncbi:MAG: hypothetical protein Q8Q94_00550 [bacterium]|nr:hypothetical protein [bacterium]
MEKFDSGQDQTKESLEESYKRIYENPEKQERERAILEEMEQALKELEGLSSYFAKLKDVAIKLNDIKGELKELNESKS